MFEYLSKLLKKWIIYLAILPNLYDYSSTYFDIDFKLPSTFISIFVIVIFVYASYKVWEDERDEKIKRTQTSTDLSSLISLIDKIQELVNRREFSEHQFLAFENELESNLNFLILKLKQIYKKDSMDKNLKDAILIRLAPMKEKLSKLAVMTTGNYNPSTGCEENTEIIKKYNDKYLDYVKTMERNFG